MRRVLTICLRVPANSVGINPLGAEPVNVIQPRNYVATEADNAAEVARLAMIARRNRRDLEALDRRKNGRSRYA